MVKLGFTGRCLVNVDLKRIEREFQKSQADSAPKCLEGQSDQTVRIYVAGEALQLY